MENSKNFSILMALRFVLCNGRGLQGMEPLFRKAFGDFCQLFLL